MLPTTYVSGLCTFIISPSNAVVVVFPLVPVIASTSPFPITYANSISPQIGVFIERNFSIIGKSVGTPGLSTSKSNSWNLSSSNDPRIISTVLSSNCDLSS